MSVITLADFYHMNDDEIEPLVMLRYLSMSSSPQL